MLGEITLFFLKYELWIPPTNPIITVRLLILCLLAAPAVREYYEYISNENCKKIGTNTWVVILMIVLEVMISVKFGDGLFHEPFPLYIKYSWIIFFVSMFLWNILFFGIKMIELKIVERILFFISIFSLFFMFFLGLPGFDKKISK
jgi:phosphatidylserine synthase 2